tara:strand:+ start:693 stop:866 length:174 start_codon:yes stop_codon:yes gene_type:complete
MKMKNKKLTDREEDMKYRQGRTKKQYESTILGTKLSIGGFILFIIFISLYRLLIHLS